MAEETKSADIEEQTSFGTYIGKQIYQNVVGFGSLIAGTYIGLLVAKPSAKNNLIVDVAQQAHWERIPFVSKLPGLKNAIPKERVMWGGGIGAFVGALTGGVILGYEHWKKIKQSQLQVDEITKDISDIEVFKKTDPELKAENERLWAELKKRDGAGSGKTMVEKSGAKKNESWKDKAEAEPDVAAEASR